MVDDNPATIPSHPLALRPTGAQIFEDTPTGCTAYFPAPQGYPHRPAARCTAQLVHHPCTVPLIGPGSTWFRGTRTVCTQPHSSWYSHTVIASHVGQAQYCCGAETNGRSNPESPTCSGGRPNRSPAPAGKAEGQAGEQERRTRRRRARPRSSEAGARLPFFPELEWASTALLAMMGRIPVMIR